MMLVFSLRSLWNRRFVAGLTVLAISLSVALILGVERLRDGARDSFANSASGIDLIVAPRGNSVQILMATVFGVGGTGAALDWDSFEMVQALPGVAWAVPISIGDNHRGYPVIGTRASYFERFRHSGGEPLVFAKGTPFSDADGAVVGAEVAGRFGYAPGTVIVNAHGAGSVAFDLHDEAPFTITGVLGPTGTAVDRMVFVSLEGFDALHADPRMPFLDPFASRTGREESADTAASAEGEPAHDLMHAPDRIDAVLVGLTARMAVLGVQRSIATYSGAALSAVMPNVALLELWSITGTAESALRLMAWAVALAGMIGMVVMLSATLDTRRREFAILRSVGATPTRIFALIVTEAAVLTAAGVILGLVLLTVATFVTDPILSARFGLRLGVSVFGARELASLFVIFCAGLLASLIPAVRVYRMTLADGLSVRL
jgi:putative ABC transport system permease protein